MEILEKGKTALHAFLIDYYEIGKCPSSHQDTKSFLIQGEIFP